MSNEPLHDDREIETRTIARLTGGLGLIVVAVLGIAWGVTALLKGEEEATHPPPPPIAAGAPTAPAEPRLQPDPAIDLQTLRAGEERKLHRYRWVDKSAGAVGIPIERAIELTAERGLPFRTEPFPASTATMPTQSTLGDGDKGGRP
jgi:hypothetical protein